MYECPDATMTITSSLLSDLHTSTPPPPSIALSTARKTRPRYSTRCSSRPPFASPSPLPLVSSCPHHRSPLRSITRNALRSIFPVDGNSTSTRAQSFLARTRNSGGRASCIELSACVRTFLGACVGPVDTRIASNSITLADHPFHDSRAVTSTAILTLASRLSRLSSSSPPSPPRLFKSTM